MKARLATCILAAGLLAGGCQRQAEDYVAVSGKVFIFNVRLARAFYMLTLKRLENLPDNAVVVAEFENPAGGPPLLREQKVFAKMTRIDIQSPDLRCVRTGKAYAIRLTVRSAEGDVLQTLDTSLNSTIDDTALPEEPLVIGGAYDRNPAAYDAEGRIKFRKPCA